MTIASGVFKKLSYKVQSGLGAPASGSGGTALPRTTSTLGLRKETYTSNDIKASQQRSGQRHGAKSVEGSISGDLIVGTHQDLEAAVLRQAWQTAATTGAQVDIAAVASGSKFTQGAGSFLTQGFKIGDVVRQSGFTGGAAALTGNFLVTSVSAGELGGVFLDGSTMIDDAAGESVTIAVVGKKNWIPATSHTRNYYTVEHYHSDITQSEVFEDCVFGSMNISLPPTGMATVDFPVMGLDMTTGTSQVLTTPTAATESGNIAAVNGVVYVNGAAVALLTGMDISVNGNVTLADPNVGSDKRADVFPGTIDVSGNATVYFQDGTMRDYFKNETEVSIVAVFTASNDADAHFKAYVLPSVKMGGADKDDGEKGLVQTMPFVAGEMVGSTTYVNSTISIQDSSVS